MAEETQIHEMQDRVVHIGRVVKVVKGGRRFSFNALVVSGDGAGRVGYGLGKASEVPEAISKASATARKNVITVAMCEGTIPYPVNSKYSASKVMMLPAKKGAGIIAGASVRAVMELAGFKDVVAKCHGSSNPHNLLKAVFYGLKDLRLKSDIWARRGLELPPEEELAHPQQAAPSEETPSEAAPSEEVPASTEEVPEEKKV